MYNRVYFQSEDISQFRLSFALLCFDVIMICSFSVASTLGGLTFYYIKKADTISMQANIMQLKLFIAVCAQVRFSDSSLILWSLDLLAYKAGQNTLH